MAGSQTFNFNQEFRDEGEDEERDSSILPPRPAKPEERIELDFVMREALRPARVPSLAVTIDPMGVTPAPSTRPARSSRRVRQSLAAAAALGVGVAASIAFSHVMRESDSPPLTSEPTVQAAEASRADARDDGPRGVAHDVSAPAGSSSVSSSAASSVASAQPATAPAASVGTSVSHASDVTRADATSHDAESAGAPQTTNARAETNARTEANAREETNARDPNRASARVAREDAPHAAADTSTAARAATTTATTPSAATGAATATATAAVPPQAELTRDDVRRGMESIRSAIEACASGEHGALSLQITVSPSGRVTSSLVDGGGFVGTPAGSCMARTGRQARFPAFTGEPVTVRYPYQL